MVAANMVEVAALVGDTARATMLAALMGGESHFRQFNDVYARYFPVEQPARIFIHVPSWAGPFDVEVDCVAVL